MREKVEDFKESLDYDVWKWIVLGMTLILVIYTFGSIIIRGEWSEYFPPYSEKAYTDMEKEVNRMMKKKDLSTEKYDEYTITHEHKEDGNTIIVKLRDGSTQVTATIQDYSTDKQKAEVERLYKSHVEYTIYTILALLLFVWVCFCISIIPSFVILGLLHFICWVILKIIP